MKTTSFLSTVCSGTVAAVVLIAFTAHSGEAPAPRPTSNTIPKSIYVPPSTRSEGRDPFFPNRFATAPTPTPVQTTGVVLVLNGISGTPQNPFAIINNRTFAKGEEQEVPSSAGRVLVRCVDIKENTVIVDVDGQRQELRLRSGI